MPTRRERLGLAGGRDWAYGRERMASPREFRQAGRNPSGGDRFESVSERVCENCGGEDDELVVVHRVYVVPESWDTAGSRTKLEETELWCFSCRSLYPHEVTED